MSTGIEPPLVPHTGLAATELDPKVYVDRVTGKPLPILVALAGGSPPPAGAATEAKQDDQIALATDANAALLDILAEEATEAKQDVIINLLTDMSADSALSATEAKQDVQITKLDAILAEEATEAKQDVIIAALTTPAAAVAGLARTATTGTVAAGKYAVAFFNAGAANATVAGGILKPGESVHFATEKPPYLAAIAYVGTGTDLMISTVGP